MTGTFDEDAILNHNLCWPEFPDQDEEEEMALADLYGNEASRHVEEQNDSDKSESDHEPDLGDEAEEVCKRLLEFSLAVCTSGSANCENLIPKKILSTWEISEA